MSKRKRILWCGEASFLNTGYGIYGREIMSRLYNTGKYDIAELACFGNVQDERRFDIPWRYYGNMPENEEQQNIYNSSMTAKFGDWRFEEVCLDFKPDIVIDIRDVWMCEHEQRSPFRRFYHWCIMPTIDSVPQQEQYINTYMDADSVLTYSDWGKDKLIEESNGHIDVVGVPSPGFSDCMKPVSNKKEHRNQFGFLDDIFIVGTIMRNQERKLYPELIEAFKIFLKNNPGLADKTYLYCHTTFPDSGWDIPKLICDSGIGHKILVTYKCRNCGLFFPSFFQDARVVCPRCKTPAAILSNSNISVNTEELASILNCFDLYVQYSTCEGFGMPQVEAAACGVPVAAVDYSAMESVVRNLKGFPIKVERMFHDSKTGFRRALPDNNHLAEIIGWFLSKPESIRLKYGRDTYLAVQKRYTWDRAAKIWENHLDSIDTNGPSWDNEPGYIREAKTSLPEGLTTEQIVRWGIENVLCEPDKVDSFMALRMIRDLNYRTAIKGVGGTYENEASFLSLDQRYEDFDENAALNKLKDIGDIRNFWERRRIGEISGKPLGFIVNSKPGDLEN